jgi:phosphate transport system permease protein
MNKTEIKNPVPMLEQNRGDLIFRRTLYGFAVLAFLILLGLIFFLAQLGWPAIQELGVGVLFKSEWNPPLKSFGILAFIYGTLVSSFLAIILATPLSIAAALVLVELAPRRIAAVFGFLIEMLAAIPSVVYGLWGLFVVIPWLRESVQPFLRDTIGFLPFFQGPIYGVSMMAAGIILAIMILPTISAITREVFLSVPRVQKEAALALGATRTEMILISVVSSSKRGIFGAMILGLSRALGETMAVTMVIGNSAEISLSLFSPHQTMASAIASEVAEAHGAHLSALGLVGLVLLIISALVFSLTRIWVVGLGTKK